MKPMKVQDCPIKGLKTVRLDVKGDSRGFFIERFHAKRFKDAGLPHEFAQDNHSRSAPGILRGLHYQQNPGQGKLVGVITGRVWDVAVDIRPGSPTFGKHHAVELSHDTLFWIPAGFAHGFCVLGNEHADMLYKVTAEYNPAGEGGIRFDDKELGIAWPLKDAKVSDRDKSLPSWRDYAAKPVQWGGA